MIKQLSVQAAQIEQGQNTIILLYTWDFRCTQWFRMKNHERGKYECFTPYFVPSAIPLSDRNSQQDAAAAIYRMASDVGTLLKCVSTFANWWSDSETMIQTLNFCVVSVRSQRMSTLRIDMVRTQWEAMQKGYETYKRSVSDRQFPTT